MNIAYSYIRFSSFEQSKGRSYARQIEKAQAYATAHGLKLDNTVIFDSGVSAYKGIHRTSGALSRFLSHIDQGLIKAGSTLLIESFDRLSREDIDQAQELIKKILRAGITIVTLMDDRIYDKKSLTDPLSLIQMIFIASRAHEESETKSKRLLEMWQKKRDLLYSQGKIISRRIPNWVSYNEKTKIFSLKPERAKIIKKIFNLASLGYGRNKIAKILNAEKVKPFKEKLWGDSSIHRIIRNPLVIGQYQPHKFTNGKKIAVGEPIPDYYPRVISDETYYYVQSKTTVKGPQNNYLIHNLFTSLVKCGRCNSSMVYVDKGYNRHYLVCDVAKRGGECNYDSIKYEDLENVFLRQCVEKLHLPENDELSKEITILNSRINGTQAKMENSRKKLQNIMVSFAEATAKEIKDQFNVLLNKINSEIETLKTSLEMDRQILLERQQATTGIKGNLKAIIDLWKIKDQKEIRLQLRNSIQDVVKIIRIHPSGVSFKDGKIISDKPNPTKKNTLRTFEIIFKDGTEVFFSYPTSI